MGIYKHTAYTCCDKQNMKESYHFYPNIKSSSHPPMHHRTRGLLTWQNVPLCQMILPTKPTTFWGIPALLILSLLLLKALQILSYFSIVDDEWFGITSIKRGLLVSILSFNWNKRCHQHIISHLFVFNITTYLYHPYLIMLIIEIISITKTIITES